MIRRFRYETLGALATLAGCSTAYYVDDADAEVARILGQATETTLGERAERLVMPDAEPPPPEPEPAAPPAEAPGAEAVPAVHATPYDLEYALATAVENNREFLARREGLYREGLSAALARFQFGPQFAAAVNYLWPQSEGGFQRYDTDANVSASQILPTGGTLSVDYGLSAAWPYGPGSGDPVYGQSAGVTLTQPLLRGAGYRVSHEPLTQAERSLVYAVRDFELFRQGFSITVAQRYFDLTSQKKTLANQDARYDAAVFDRKKAQALQQVGRNTEQEVFRARRTEISAKDELINARAAYDLAVDEFKILLGLPTSANIEIVDAEPDYEPVRFEVTSAVQAALENRLDLITERQRVEDVERGLLIAENALLPDLDLVAGYGVDGFSGDFGGSAPDEWNASIGLSMSIPIQQKPERNNYRSTMISLAQARRGLDLLEDRLELEIRNSVRQLKSLEERIALQEGQVTQERGSVTVIEIRYEAGQADNRDLIEARQALVDAQNALIRLKVDHFISRLRLLSDIGIFFVDDRGMWP